MASLRAVDPNTRVTEQQEEQDSKGVIKGGTPSDEDETPWHLPLDKFTAYALKFAEPEPDDIYQYRTPMWRFTRLIRSWCTEGTKPDSLFDMVEKVVKKKGGWDMHFNVSDERAYTEFKKVWKAVRLRADESPLQTALVKATAYPVPAPRHDNRKRPTPGYDRFVCFAVWLQITVGDRPIFLPMRAVAKALQTDATMIKWWRDWAVEEDLFELTKEHDRLKRKATEFRVKPWLVTWFKKYLDKKLD